MSIFKFMAHSKAHFTDLNSGDGGSIVSDPTWTHPQPENNIANNLSPASVIYFPHPSESEIKKKLHRVDF